MVTFSEKTNKVSHKDNSSEGHCPTKTDSGSQVRWDFLYKHISSDRDIIQMSDSTQFRLSFKNMAGDYSLLPPFAMYLCIITQLFARNP